jgi:uncharacterized membrane protein HdeD (DUF308 family)
MTVPERPPFGRREAGQGTVWDYPALAGLVMFLTGVGAVLTVGAALLGADWVIGGVLTLAGVLVVVGLLVLAAATDENGDSTKDEDK